MKKIGEIMGELGFNSQAPDSVKEAFVKHLIRASTGVTVETPSERRAVESNPQQVKKIHKTPPPQQLSFDFSESSAVSSQKKAVS